MRPTEEEREAAISSVINNESSNGSSPLLALSSFFSNRFQPPPHHHLGAPGEKRPPARRNIVSTAGPRRAALLPPPRRSRDRFPSRFLLPVANSNTTTRVQVSRRFTRYTSLGIIDRADSPPSSNRVEFHGIAYHKLQECSTPWPNSHPFFPTLDTSLRRPSFHRPT